MIAVGGLTDRKNPLGLLQAFARLHAVRPDARLALVGDGPLARAVDVGVARMGLGDAVVRTGALPHDEVADWVAACDMLALVSRVEPLGVVALEALAGGRPVVATRIGGTREVVPDPRAGRVVDPLDPAAIAARDAGSARPSAVAAGLPRRGGPQRPDPPGAPGGGHPRTRGRTTLTTLVVMGPACATVRDRCR